jgi:two-component system, LytTR family, response regulator
MRVMIVEDEPLAAQLLESMLRRQHDVQVVGSHRKAAPAITAIEQQLPEVLFLDIQLPGVDGFELLGKLPPESLPLVVFVTAHGEHAARAFDVEALDFLTKPFDQARLDAAVERVRRRLRERRTASDQQRLLDVLAELRSERRFERRLPVWSAGDQRAALIPVEDVTWIEADGKQLQVHTTTATFRIRRPLAELQEALDPATFLRVSRSAIVNVDHIREIQKWFRGDFLLVLKSGDKVKSAATYRAAIARLLGKG